MIVIPEPTRPKSFEVKVFDLSVVLKSPDGYPENAAIQFSSLSTNVLGTANILECCRLSKSVKAVIVITSDKCYENKEWAWGYRESDKLGGKDPYSASKSSSELVVESYKHSILNPNNKIKPFVIIKLFA